MIPLTSLNITHAFVLAGLGLALAGLGLLLLGFTGAFAVVGHFFARGFAWLLSRQPPKVRPPWATVYRKP